MLIGGDCGEVIVTKNRATLAILLVMIQNNRITVILTVEDTYQYTVRQKVRTNEGYMSFTKSKKENGKIERSDWQTGSRPPPQLSYLLKLI